MKNINNDIFKSKKMQKLSNKHFSEIIYLVQRMNNSNRTIEEKVELINIYLKHINKKYIKNLICSSMVLNTCTFKEQKEDIKKYVKNEKYYEEIINKCYIRSMKINYDDNYSYKLNK